MTATEAAFDNAALAALEFDAVLAQIAARATSELGQRAVLGLSPTTDLAAAAAQLALVEDTLTFFRSGSDFALTGVADMADALDRAEVGGALSGVELRRIADNENTLVTACRAIAGAKRQGTANRWSPLLALALTLAPTGSLVTRLTSALEEDGRVADRASPALAKIRRQQRALHDEVRERCQSITRNPETAKMLSEPIVTIRRSRYVVPVRVEFAHQFAGVVHDQSASGATVFIEPMAAVDANNQLRSLETAEEREVARVLVELTGLTAAQGDALRANASLSASLDSAAARARWAVATQAGSPSLSDRRIVRIVQGRHPLLRRVAVPLDIDVGDAFDALIISGPNMGGKTVMLKTVGLFCVMAYAGIPLPASAGTVIGAFDHIACVIGDEQSIAENLSSFSAHLRALRAAQARAGAGSLILVDEIGSGTEPGAGAALAQAFVEAMLAAGARAIVTTHYTQLKIFAADHARVANASMLFDPATNEPTYILLVGVPGRSLAFALARAIGFDAATIERAETLLGAEAMDLERVFASLADQREQFRLKVEELEAQQRRAGELESGLRRELSQARAERSEFERKAAEELARAVRNVAQEVRAKAQQGAEDARRQRPKPAPNVDEALDRTLSEMRRSLGLEQQRPAANRTAEDSGDTSDGTRPKFRVGDAVFVRTFGANGIVADVYDRDVLVTIGNAKTVVAPADLSLAGPAAGPVARVPGGKRGGEMQSAAERAATRIDVRGMRVEEAMPIVDKALDDASLAGLHELRVLHGKGTGQLGRGIREFLRGHLQVAETAFAPDREGGSGVTVISLK
jgi:DNA mismatch repair protein MutS2